jgi:hypothetical protein
MSQPLQQSAPPLPLKSAFDPTVASPPGWNTPVFYDVQSPPTIESLDRSSFFSHGPLNPTWNPPVTVNRSIPPPPGIPVLLSPFHPQTPGPVEASFLSGYSFDPHYGGGSAVVRDNPFETDDDQIEADLQELGGQMIGSVLDF